MSKSRNHRTRHEDLAQRIEPTSTWADLAMPEPQLHILRELAAARLPVSKDPQSGIKILPDRGIMALFTGPSGTGKTMAAEVLARELRLGLYRIDLTRVVSNYIGETEKTLSRIFAEAAPKGAILFFDEADALFGKRSEVKDSHDRYANMEVNYFLQRAEEHRGLVILATKTPHDLAPALPLRIDFIVQFSPPDAGEREGPNQSMAIRR
jgi:SpoVK/Ycf46/Vps4 family AAA+-type ATPase